MAKTCDRKQLFPFAFNVCRKNPVNPSTYEKTIYKGFGLNHKSTTTNIYKSSLNKTRNSSVCQPIGEAISLLSEIITSEDCGNTIATYKSDLQGNTTYLELIIPQEYRDNGIIPDTLYKYKVLKEHKTIIINAYDSSEWLIPDDYESTGEIHYHTLNKMLPIFTLLLLDHKMTVPEFSDAIDKYAHAPTIENFVRIHEDFYHMNKTKEFEVKYEDLDNYENIIDSLTSLTFYNKPVTTTLKNTKSKKKVTIKQFKKDSFTTNQQSFIPSLSKEIVLPEEYKAFCNAVFDGASIATLFHGPSGTGKSMLCKLICQAINLPVMQVINCSENLDEYILGKYIPKDDKIVFLENPITEAVRNGGAVVFEEINFAKPQHLAFLHSLLDDNGMITLDDGTIIRRHPNFRLFATMNDGYFGTKELNQATINRFNYIKEVPELCDEAIANMLITRVPQFANYVDQMIQVYKSIKSKAVAEDIEITISPRNLENWAKIAQYEGFIDAAKSTILPVAKMDRKLEQAILGIIQTHKWSS